MNLKTFLIFATTILCWMSHPLHSDAQPQSDGYVHDVIQLEDFKEFATTQSFELDHQIKRNISDFHITGTLHSKIVSNKWESDYIQFKPKTISASQGLITTSSLGYAKVVTITWCTNNQSNAAVKIYGNDDPDKDFDDSWTEIETIITSPGQTNSTTKLVNTPPKKYIAIIGVGNNAFISSIDIAWQQTDYERENLTPGSLNTLCLPYSAAIPDGMNVYEIAGKVMEGEEVVSIEFSPVNKIEAGLPYVFTTSQEQIQLSLQGEKCEHTASNKNGLYGTFVDYPFVDDRDYNYNDYFIINGNNEIQAASEKSGVRANRAFIKLSEVPVLSSASALPAQRLTINFANESTTSIESPATHVACNAQQTVDLSARILPNNATLPHGIYVANGRKIIK